MITGLQARLSRSLIVDTLPLSNVVTEHTAPALVAKMKSYSGQAIPTEQMVGLEQMTASFKLAGSVAAAKMALGKGFTQLIDVIVSDSGNIGDNGVKYVHTYVYAVRVKSITPVTDADGSDGADIELSVTSYEYKFNGVTVDEVNARTGKIVIGGFTHVEAVH